MRITYGGAAYRMYAESNPDGCQAVEMAPAVWQIYIEDYEDTDCPVVADNMGDIGDTSLWKLNVVVQRGMVRKIDDPYKQIICNYGLGGKTDTNRTGIAGDAELENSIRVFNCRVFAEDYTSYYFMLEGCGK